MAQARQDRVASTIVPRSARIAPVRVASGRAAQGAGEIAGQVGGAEIDHVRRAEPPAAISAGISGV